MEIAHIFDPIEEKYLFYLKNEQGGPIIYADTIEEGEKIVKELVKVGQQMVHLIEVGEKTKMKTFVENLIAQSMESIQYQIDLLSIFLINNPDDWFVKERLKENQSKAEDYKKYSKMLSGMLNVEWMMHQK